MSDSLLSPTIITREALKVLHQKSVFIRSINRQYDDRFANSGASPSGKIGPTLQIRLPNQFTVRTGTTLSVQDISEDKVALTVSTTKGVDFTFPTTDLTLTIDRFSDRYLKPAMARLAADIEADSLNMVKDVYNFVDQDATALAPLHFLQVGQKLDESLAPDDGDRTALLIPTHNTKFVDSVKGQFNPQAQIGSQFVSGEVAKNTLGFDSIKRSTLLTQETTGTCAKVTGYSIDSTGTVTGSTITIKTGANTFLKGDVITIATLNAVHPETKADLGYLRTFVVTANSGANATSLSISPAIVTTGAKQNVSAAIVADQLIVKVGAGASETYTQSLFYHKDAFTFVTADLEDVSKYGAWGSRQQFDGISMRIARQYDIVNDKIPCRMDVLYGYLTVRPQLACRLHADG
jgi:hypothetical protein